MALFDNMNPATKRILLVGIPVVAVIAFVVLVKSKGSSTTASTPSTTGTTAGGLAPYPGTAIDTGQLAAYESTVSNQLAGIQQALAGQQTVDGSSPTPAAVPVFTTGVLGPSAGQFTEVAGPTQNEQFAAAGVPQYAETAPGQFVLVPPSTGGEGLAAYAPVTYTLNPAA